MMKHVMRQKLTGAGKAGWDDITIRIGGACRPAKRGDQLVKLVIGGGFVKAGRNRPVK